MSFMVWLLVGSVVFLIFLFAMVVIFDRKSYKFKALVFVPTGEDPNDGIWVDDRFKTRKQKGNIQVRFLRNKGKCYSPDHRFWNKYLKVNKNVPPNASDDGWARVDDQDFRKHLVRGAIFRKVSDDEYKVVKFDKLGNFKVIDHDSRELIIDDIEREKELSATWRERLLQAGVWIGSLFIIGLLLIALFVLTTKFAGEQSAQIVGAAKQAIIQQAAVGA